MKLYYTVSSAPEDPQPKPHLSCGGFKSSTPVPNDVFGSLFGDISMYSVKARILDHYIALILVNESGSPVASPKIWFDQEEDCYSYFEVAALDLTSSSVGEYMEQIRSFENKPLFANFISANGADNMKSLGAMGVRDKVGLWIHRRINLDKVKEDQNKIFEISAEDPYRYNKIDLKKFDNFNFSIRY